MNGYFPPQQTTSEVCDRCGNTEFVTQEDKKMYGLFEEVDKISSDFVPKRVTKELRKKTEKELKTFEPVSQNN